MGAEGGVGGGLPVPLSSPTSKLRFLAAAGSQRLPAGSKNSSLTTRSIQPAI